MTIGPPLVKTNGEAIYGASALPFPYDFEWGRTTAKRHTLYLHVFDWPRGPLRLNGLSSRVRGVRLLADPRASLEFTAEHDPRPGGSAPSRSGCPAALPTAMSRWWPSTPSVPLEVDQTLQQQPLGGIFPLPAHAAEMHFAEYWGRMRIGQGGVDCDWYSTDNRVAHGGSRSTSPGNSTCWCSPSP